MFRREKAQQARLFKEDRDRLFKLLSEMVEVAQRALDKAMRALLEHSDDLALEVIRVDEEKVDLLEIEIERECLRLIAMRQPVREELRFVFSVLKIITDLERIGDQAVNIAQRTLDLNREGLLKPLVDIPKMAEICQEMISGAIRSMVEMDAELAKAVSLKDEKVDALNHAILAELVEIAGRTHIIDPLSIKKATDLMLVARHLERVGDHASNIAERSFFFITGKRIKEELVAGKAQSS